MRKAIKEKQSLYSYFILSVILLGFILYSTVALVANPGRGPGKLGWMSVYQFYLVLSFLLLDLTSTAVFAVLSGLFFIVYLFVSPAGNFPALSALAALVTMLLIFVRAFKRRDNLVSRMNIVMDEWSSDRISGESEIRNMMDRKNKLEERYGRFHNLKDIVVRFSSTLERHELEKICISETKEIIGRGSVSLAGLKAGHPVPDPVNRWVVEREMPVIIESVRSDYRFAGLTPGDHSASVIAAPVRIENRVVEVLRCSSHTENDYREEDLRLLSIVADFLSIALTNSMLYDRIEELAITDGLTGLYTRRFFFERLDDECHRALKFGSPLSVAMLDIDLFKNYNDIYGHPAGDELLKKVSAIIRDNLRDTDIVGRYGGEEFIVLMPMAMLADAYSKIEKIRQNVEATGLLTVSAGVSEFDSSGRLRNRMVENADRALYRAKNNGRNRVERFRS